MSDPPCRFIVVRKKDKMTTMFRKTTCNGCGMSQTTNVSYRLDKKLWETTHTLGVCRQRKALLTRELDFSKPGASLRNLELLNSLN
jgi:transcription elongation factor Elf1